MKKKILTLTVFGLAFFLTTSAANGAGQTYATPTFNPAVIQGGQTTSSRVTPMPQQQYQAVQQYPGQQYQAPQQYQAYQAPAQYPGQYTAPQQYQAYPAQQQYQAAPQQYQTYQAQPQQYPGQPMNNDLVLQGGVSQTQIKPYYDNWSTVEAYNRINLIGERLLDVSDVEDVVTFQVTKSQEANAHVDLGNNINIYTGLLTYVENEDELAYVIGHELAHAQEKHVIKGVVRSGALTVLTGVGGAFADSTGAKVAVGGFALGGKMIDQKISRNDEFTSDLTSIDYLVKAGYNPLAAISLINKISGNYFDFMSDHPSGTRRIMAMYMHIQKNYPDFINSGYDTVSYGRALKIINKKLAKSAAKASR